VVRAFRKGKSFGLCSLLCRGCATIANLTLNARWFLFGVLWCGFDDFLNFFIRTGCLVPAGVHFAFRAAVPSALCSFSNADPCPVAARLSGLIELVTSLHKFIRHQ